MSKDVLAMLYVGLFHLPRDGTEHPDGRNGSIKCVHSFVCSPAAVETPKEVNCREYFISSSCRNEGIET